MIPNPSARCEHCPTTYHVKATPACSLSEFIALATKAGWTVVDSGRCTYCPEHTPVAFLLDVNGQPADTGVWLVNDAGEGVTRHESIADALQDREHPGDHVVIVDIWSGV